MVEQFGQVVDEDQTPLVIRGLALRCHQLNSVAMSALGSEDPDARERARLARLVLGEAAALTKAPREQPGVAA